MSKAYKRRPSPSQYSQTWNNAEFSAVERSQSDGPYLPLTGGTVTGNINITAGQLIASLVGSNSNGTPLTLANGGTVVATLSASLATLPFALAVAGGVGFNGATPVSKRTVTGSRGGNAALASLLTALATLGLITDSSTP